MSLETFYTDINVHKYDFAFVLQSSRKQYNGNHNVKGNYLVCKQLLCLYSNVIYIILVNLDMSYKVYRQKFIQIDYSFSSNFTSCILSTYASD